MDINLTPYLILTVIICIFALVVTVMIGLNPKGEEYSKNQRRHFTNLTVIYIVVFVPALILTVLYFVYF
ncbi:MULTISPECIES: hypothetical protein [Bacillaceae]|uniref:BshB3 potential contributor to bacillithiol synthesis n=1 Tax=Evansella alkalicola TaxID=745819 RepID=A0ABS6JYP9_9BACI|nr:MULTISPECIES: hypothetical protein [Bacillaceae]MBU9723352.1 hypothetical protein [Bacillus alkalicola]